MKPLTYMNRSGEAVMEFLGFFKVDPNDVLVVSDDVNLPLGRLRLRRGGSAGGHNGLQSIIDALGSDAIPRLRIGVGAAPGELTSHVLGRFAPGEQPLLEDALVLATDAAAKYAAGSTIEDLMNTYNRTEAGPPLGPPAAPEDKS